MGGCCSQVNGRMMQKGEPGVAKVTDNDLRNRTPTRALSPLEATSLLDSYQSLAYQSFLRRLEAALTGDAPIPDSNSFVSILAQAKDDANNFFRSLFVQGSQGEAVPVELILAAQQTLRCMCEQDSDLFGYCNSYRSFVKCSAVKRRLVEECLFRGETNKLKIVRLYDQEAEGPYFSLCRTDLETLIVQYPKTDRSFVLTELKKQSVADREILRRDREKAEQRSKRPVPDGFRTGGEERMKVGGESYTAMNDRLSVLELIDRLPDVNLPLDAHDASEGYFTLQGEVVAKGPIKKHKTTGDRPRPSPIHHNPSATCSDQKVTKIAIDENEEINSELKPGSTAAGSKRTVQKYC